MADGNSAAQRVAVPGGSPRTLGTQTADVANVLDHGAFCDGQSHPLSRLFPSLPTAKLAYPAATSLANEADWAAIMHAAATGKAVYVPSAVCVSNATITWPTTVAARLRGDGAGVSEIRFTGPGDGIVAANTACHRLPPNITDLSVTTALQEPGRAVVVSCAGTDLNTYGEYSFGRIERLDVRGTDFRASGWTKGIHATDAGNIWIQNNNVIGRRDIAVTTPASFQNMTVGIEFTGSGAQMVGGTPIDATPFHVLFNHVYSAATCFQDDGYVEGGEYLLNYAVGCGTGYNTARTGQRPAVRYDGNHANVFSAGIVVANAPQSWVTNNLIYKIQLATGVTTGLLLENSSQTHVSGNQFQNQARDAAVSGDWMGMRVSDSAFVQLDANVCDRPSNCLTISGTSTMVHSRRTESLGMYANATPMQAYIDTSIGQNDRTDGPVVVATLASTSAVATTSTPTVVPATSYGFSNVEAGQNFLISGTIIHTQGSGGGVVGAGLVQIAGTATASFGPGVVASQTAMPGAQTVQTFTTVARIQTGGTLQLGLQVQNLGSAGGTIATGGLQMSIVKQ